MSNPVSVTVLEDGPLKVSGASTLRYRGEPLAVTEGEDVYLCRCGDSANAPFCDGTHRKKGFDGSSEKGTLKEIKVWEGRNIRTFFNPNACMHVFYCKPLDDLRQAEVDGDDSAAAEIARIVQTCPSGALSYEAKALPEPDLGERADIDIIEGGEVRIQCAFEINAELHERQNAERATLCRCGMSKSKPWCDGRHKGRKDFR